MDTDPQVGVEVYKITRDDYGRSPHGVLTTVAATGVLTTLWVLVSWLFDRFIPYFRSEFIPFGSQAWLIHAVVLGFFWSILMVLWGSFRRKRLEFEIEIMPDQIAKRWNKGSGLIYRERCFWFARISNTWEITGTQCDFQVSSVLHSCWTREIR